MSLLQGLTRVDRQELTDDEKARISNNVGALSGRSHSG